MNPPHWEAGIWDFYSAFNPNSKQTLHQNLPGINFSRSDQAGAGIYPYLTLGQIHAALALVYENPGVEAIIVESEKSKGQNRIGSALVNVV